MLSKETLNWLLEPDNQPVRYLTMLHLDGAEEGDADVKTVKADIMNYKPIKKILAKQNPDGSFYTQKMVDEYDEIRAKYGYQPKYRNTIWQALFLAQMEASPEDLKIQKLCNFILDYNYSDEHETFGIYAEKRYGLEFLLIPCFISNMVWTLSKLGFHEDERVQNAIKWIVKYQRFDDGDFTTPDEAPYLGGKDRCFGKHSCYIGCAQALKAMTAIPKEKRTKEIEKFIKKAVDFVLLHKVYQKNHKPGEPIRKDLVKLMFPVGYYDGVLDITETLMLLGVKSPKMNDALKLIKSKANEEGRWTIERIPSPSLATPEPKGAESKWLTYKALRVLKHYGKI